MHPVLRQEQTTPLRSGEREFSAGTEGYSASSERGAASLTTKGLDSLDTAMLAISDQGVDVSIGDPEVRAEVAGTSEPLGVDAFGGSPSAFHLRPGTHRQRHPLNNRRGSGGETTGGAIVWAAGLQQTVERRALGPCAGYLAHPFLEKHGFCEQMCQVASTTSCKFGKKPGKKLLSRLLSLRRRVVLSSSTTKEGIQPAQNTGTEQLADVEAVLSPVEAPSPPGEYADSTHA